jgi:hypothetical protein
MAMFVNLFYAKCECLTFSTLGNDTTSSWKFYCNVLTEKKEGWPKVLKARNEASSSKRADHED